MARPGPASTSPARGSAPSTRSPRASCARAPSPPASIPEFGELDETESASLAEQALDEAMERSLANRGFLDLVSDAPTVTSIREATRHVHDRLRAAGQETPRILLPDAPEASDAQRTGARGGHPRGRRPRRGPAGPPRAAPGRDRDAPGRRGRLGSAAARPQLLPRLQALRGARQHRRRGDLPGAARPRGPRTARGLRRQPGRVLGALRRAQARARRPRLRGPAAGRPARPAGGPPLRLRPRLRRRVPGRERPPGRDRRPAAGRAHRRGRRRLPGDLRLPPRRPRPLRRPGGRPAGRDAARQPPQPAAAARGAERPPLGGPVGGVRVRAPDSRPPARRPGPPLADAPARGDRRRLGRRRRRHPGPGGGGRGRPRRLASGARLRVAATSPCCSGPSPRSSRTGRPWRPAASRRTSSPGGASSPTIRSPTPWPCSRSSRTRSTSRPCCGCSPRPTRPSSDGTSSTLRRRGRRAPTARIAGPARARCCRRPGRSLRRGRRSSRPRPCGRSCASGASPGWWRPRSRDPRLRPRRARPPRRRPPPRQPAKARAHGRATSRRCGARTCAASSACCGGWPRPATRTPARRPSSIPTSTRCAWRRSTRVKGQEFPAVVLADASHGLPTGTPMVIVNRDGRAGIRVVAGRGRRRAYALGYDELRRRPAPPTRPRSAA